MGVHYGRTCKVRYGMCRICHQICNREAEERHSRHSRGNQTGGPGPGQSGVRERGRRVQPPGQSVQGRCEERGLTMQTRRWGEKVDEVSVAQSVWYGAVWPPDHHSRSSIPSRDSASTLRCQAAYFGSLILRGLLSLPEESMWMTASSSSSWSSFSTTPLSFFAFFAVVALLLLLASFFELAGLAPPDDFPLAFVFVDVEVVEEMDDLVFAFVEPEGDEVLLFVDLSPSSSVPFAMAVCLVVAYVCIGVRQKSLSCLCPILSMDCR